MVMQGMQPFEKFREERRTAREQRLRMASEQAGPSTSAAARPKEPNPFDDEDSDEDDEDETLDFRAGRNQGGQGCALNPFAWLLAVNQACSSLTLSTQRCPLVHRVPIRQVAL